MGEGVVGLGIDIIEIDRFVRMAGEGMAGAASRIFTDGELGDSRAGRPDFLASRFASKEAVMKAIGRGMGSISFTDIEVVSSGADAPEVRLFGSAAEWAEKAGVSRILLSISHSRDYACASAVALGGVSNEAGLSF
ncbi:MAG: holo-ACP synthase [Clostridia bacterium]|nr:holo-ACP synthase [Clostridia bacterium]